MAANRDVVAPAPWWRDDPQANSERGVNILKAAANLFIREGGAAFSTRAVAKEAGVSLGSLQHIFPSKDRLFAAMLKRRISEYDAIHARAVEGLPFNGEKRLLGVIEQYIDDIWRPETRGFYFNLFALSCHNSFAADLMRDAYERYRRALAGYIGAARPTFSETRCLDIALQIAALIEGLMVYTAPNAKAVKREHLQKLIKESVLMLISDGPETTRITGRVRG